MVNFVGSIYAVQVSRTALICERQSAPLLRHVLPASYSITHYLLLHVAWYNRVTNVCY